MEWMGWDSRITWDREIRTGQGRAVRVRAVAPPIDRPGGLRSVLVVLGGLGGSLYVLTVQGGFAFLRILN